MSSLYKLNLLYLVFVIQNFYLIAFFTANVLYYDYVHA